MLNSLNVRLSLHCLTRHALIYNLSLRTTSGRFPYLENSNFPILLSTPGQRKSTSELNVGPISNSTEKVQAINDARFDEILKLSLIHISEPTRRYAISYAVFCLKKKKN